MGGTGGGTAPGARIGLGSYSRPPEPAIRPDGAYRALTQLDRDRAASRRAGRQVLERVRLRATGTHCCTAKMPDAYVVLDAKDAFFDRIVPSTASA